MKAVRWVDGVLEVLDQTRLPVEEHVLKLRDHGAVAAAIREMRVRGAPAIGVTAAYGFVLAVERYEGAPGAALERHVEDACRVLAATRPTAVNLVWALGRMRRRMDALAAADLASLREGLLAEARAIDQEDEAANKRMGEHGAALIKGHARILTHCNTGDLATAGHGTALGVIRSAHAQGKVAHVWVDETRPYLQGARLTAWELKADGIPHRLIADSMAAMLMARGEVDLVIVGADRITARGDVANKIGTYALAVLAKHHGLPFYVAAPLSTVDLSLKEPGQIKIEERPARELTHIGPLALAPEGTPVFNPAFDVTPHALITAIITPAGVVRAPLDKGLREAIEREAPAPVPVPGRGGAPKVSGAAGNPRAAGAAGSPGSPATPGAAGARSTPGGSGGSGASGATGGPGASGRPARKR